MTPGEARDRAIIAGMAAVFPPALLLARDALLLWAKDHEPDGWPTVPAVIRFAAAHEVSAQELGALVGIISFRLTPRGKVVWADTASAAPRWSCAPRRTGCPVASSGPTAAMSPPRLGLRPRATSTDPADGRFRGGRLKIGARVVRNARAITFQLAEVAITGAMVRAILAAIRRLRAPPSRA